MHAQGSPKPIRPLADIELFGKRVFIGFSWIKRPETQRPGRMLLEEMAEPYRVNQWVWSSEEIGLGYSENIPDRGRALAPLLMRALRRAALHNSLSNSLVAEIFPFKREGRTLYWLFAAREMTMIPSFCDSFGESREEMESRLHEIEAMYGEKACSLKVYFGGTSEESEESEEHGSDELTQGQSRLLRGLVQERIWERFCSLYSPFPLHSAACPLFVLARRLFRILVCLLLMAAFFYGSYGALLHWGVQHPSESEKTRLMSRRAYFEEHPEALFGTEWTRSVHPRPLFQHCVTAMENEARYVFGWKIAESVCRFSHGEKNVQIRLETRYAQTPHSQFLSLPEGCSLSKDAKSLLHTCAPISIAHEEKEGRLLSEEDMRRHFLQMAVQFKVRVETKFSRALTKTIPGLGTFVSPYVRGSFVVQHILPANLSSFLSKLSHLYGIRPGEFGFQNNAFFVKGDLYATASK